jgi:hypothetical protein
MELNFEEIEPLDTTINTNNNIQEPIKNMREQNIYKKPKISYDDILSSLNLKVNNGKLEYLRATPRPGDSLRTCYRKQELQEQQQQLYQNNHDYYSQEQPIPISKEEYKKRVILEFIRRDQERKRIAQIKSKKLLFAQNNQSAPSYAVPTNINKLFRLLN